MFSSWCPPLQHTHPLCERSRGGTTQIVGSMSRYGIERVRIIGALGMKHEKIFARGDTMSTVTPCAPDHLTTTPNTSKNVWTGVR